MTRRLTASIAAAALAAGIAVPSALAAGTINGKFNGFTITLSGGAKASGSNGKATTKAGSTTFVFNDNSAIHNFVLQKGTGAPSAAQVVKARNGKAIVTDKNINSVSAKGGVQRFTANLAKGKYTIYCTPHVASGMKVTLTVT